MTYCTVDEIKEELDIQDEDKDNLIASYIEQVKEYIDIQCNRKFDTVSETRYFDGSSSPFFIDDLSNLDGGSDGIFLDEDGDGVWEETMATTDYILYPLNTTPKTKIEISNDSDYSSFALGVKKGVKITAAWGPIPKPIKMASIIMVSELFEQRKARGFKSERLGDYSYQIMEESAANKMIAPFRKKVL